MKIAKKLWMATAALAALVTAASAYAQAPTAAVHGTIINAAGLPITTGTVELTTDHQTAPKDAKMAYSFPISSSGSYEGQGINPAEYVVYVHTGGNFVDRLTLTLKPGDNATLNFDMTREEYIKGLSEEDRKKLEEYKKNASAATAANKVIGNLNTTLKAVREDLKSASPNYDKDVDDMKQATTQKPDEGVLWMELGDAHSAKADSLAAADRKAGKPAMSDDEVLKHYSDAVDAYKKGIDLNVASKKPSPSDQAVGYNQMGTALARSGKLQDAQAAYESAAKLVPANAGMYYGNEAAILYNASQTNPQLSEGALSAAEKAIAADPNRPDPYFIKGQILLQKATLDPKTQKIVPPEGCVDAYQKYLELAPDGRNAASVKEVLNTLDVKVQTHYKAGRK